jgi:hypothetical protein
MWAIYVISQELQIYGHLEFTYEGNKLKVMHHLKLFPYSYLFSDISEYLPSNDLIIIIIR